MALIYEIIDTKNEKSPAQWKRLIAYNIQNNDTSKLLDNFVKSNVYEYSNPSNLKCKIIEKVMETVDIQQTLRNRKNLWIQTRIDRYGKDCFLIKRGTTNINPDIPAIIEIKEEPKKEIIEPPKVEIKEIDQTIEPEEILENEETIVDENTEEIIEENTSDITTETEEPIINENKEDDEEIEEDTEELNENDSNIDVKELKFENTVYGSVEDLFNDLKEKGTDITIITLKKAVAGNVSKNMKKKYGNLLSQITMRIDDEWKSLL